MNRSRITKLAFVIVFICFLLSTFVSLWSLRVMAKHNRQELSKQLAARIYDTIIGELSEPVTVASTRAHDQFLIDNVGFVQDSVTSNTVFNANVATEEGGAVYSDDSTLNFTGVQFTKICAWLVSE